jgi:hypothetical protein
MKGRTWASISCYTPKLFHGVYIEERRMPSSAREIISVKVSTGDPETIDLDVAPSVYEEPWATRRIVFSRERDLSKLPVGINFLVSEPQPLIIKGETIWVFLESGL